MKKFYKLRTRLHGIIYKYTNTNTFSVFTNIHEYANYANMITCIFDHGMKGLCLSFILV